MHHSRGALIGGAISDYDKQLTGGAVSDYSNLHPNSMEPRMIYFALLFPA